MHHQCIISASSVHHQCIISARSAHHQRIISASSVHHLCIISVSSVHYCCIISVSSVHRQCIKEVTLWVWHAKNNWSSLYSTTFNWIKPEFRTVVRCLVLPMFSFAKNQNMLCLRYSISEFCSLLFVDTRYLLKPSSCTNTSNTSVIFCQETQHSIWDRFLCVHTTMQSWKGLTNKVVKRVVIFGQESQHSNWV